MPAIKALLFLLQLLKIFVGTYFTNEVKLYQTKKKIDMDSPGVWNAESPFPDTVAI